MTALLEHVNVTVSDAKKTAAMLQDLFGWRIRWQGPAINNGYTVHVGGEQSYLAVYSPEADADAPVGRHQHRGSLNHIGVVVDDLNAVEARVVKAGYTPRSHADYEPGKRFYFDADDGIEVEVVSYN